MQSLKSIQEKTGASYKLRPHPRYSDMSLLRKLSDEVHIENPQQVSIQQSISNSIGLVYIEALSQNLPVLYTKNQGIDGLFGPEVGEAVNPLSEDEIVEGLKKILTGTGYSNRNIDFEEFRWSHVAAKYKEIYKATLGCKDVDQNLLEGYLLSD